MAESLLLVILITLFLSCTIHYSYNVGLCNISIILYKFISINNIISITPTIKLHHDEYDTNEQFILSKMPASELTFSGNKRDRFSSNICPATLKVCYEGTEVAGIYKFLYHKR